MQDRTKWIDIAKAIGIILVVYGHVARGLHSAGVTAGYDLYESVDSVIYSFHMPLFFFLSGLHFVKSYQHRGPAKLFLSKIDTLVYPYLLWSVVQGLTEVLISKYTNGKLSAGEIFSHLLVPRAQFWFLYALFFITCLAIFTYRLSAAKAALSLLFLSTLAYLMKGLIPFHVITFYISAYLVYFVLGLFISKYSNRAVQLDGATVMTFTLLFILCQFALRGAGELTGVLKNICSLTVAVASILYVVALSLWVSKYNVRMLSLIGAASMPIYLMHILAGSGIRIVMSKLLGIDSLMLHLLAGTFFGLLLPVVAYRLITRFNIKYILSAPAFRA